MIDRTASVEEVSMLALPVLFAVTAAAAAGTTNAYR
jgi:hypothetical protein